MLKSTTTTNNNNNNNTNNNNSIAGIGVSPHLGWTSISITTSRLGCLPRCGARAAGATGTSRRLAIANVVNLLDRPLFSDVTSIGLERGCQLIKWTEYAAMRSRRAPGEWVEQQQAAGRQESGGEGGRGTRQGRGEGKWQL